MPAPGQQCSRKSTRDSSVVSWRDVVQSLSDSLAKVITADLTLNCIALPAMRMEETSLNPRSMIPASTVVEEALVSGGNSPDSAARFHDRCCQEDSWISLGALTLIVACAMSPVLRTRRIQSRFAALMSPLACAGEPNEISRCALALGVKSKGTMSRLRSAVVRNQDHQTMRIRP